MAPQWDWMRERCGDAEVLNLFGYTGVGTLQLSDAARGWSMSTRRRSRSRQGKENARLSGMAERPIRWIVDDAASSPRARSGAAGATTASCSIRRNSAAGPTGEVWRLEENLAPLLADCRKLLDATAASWC